MQVNGNGCDDSPSRYPVMSARTPGVTPSATTVSYTLPGTPTLLEEHSSIRSESCICEMILEWLFKILQNYKQADYLFVLFNLGGS